MCRADECLYGGAVGGAKTESLLAFIIARRIKYPGSTGLALRRTIPELEGGDGLITRAKRFLRGHARWRERQRRFEFPNGSVQEFGHCEHEDDAHRYDGGEYADICFDEVQNFTEWQYTYIRSRCRAKVRPDGTTIPAVLRATGMPSGIGCGWVKRLFVDPMPDGGEWSIDLGSGLEVKRAFIPARLEDNRFINADAYKKHLMQLPESLRRSLLEGRWDVVHGRYFTMFEPAKHVIRKPLEGWWPRFLAIDYGFSAPFCALWASVDERGRIHFYREIYAAGLKDEEQAQRVIAAQIGEPAPVGKADPSCWNKRGETGRSVAEVWAECGLYVARASNDRIPGWGRLRSFLMSEIDGAPAMTIDPGCEYLIRQLNECVSARRNPEDIDTRQEDHAADAARYLVADLRPAGMEIGPPDPVVPKIMRDPWERPDEGIPIERLVEEPPGDYGDMGDPRQRWAAAVEMDRNRADDPDDLF